MPVQKDLFQNVKGSSELNISEWGTFKDSMKAPVHRWFTYPAGFSFKAVEHSLSIHNLKKGNTIYDPFMGSATTNLVAKVHGMNSVGVEPHPFVFDIAKAKMSWEISEKKVLETIEYISKNFQKYKKKILVKSFDLNDYFPPLVIACYEEKTLIDLLILKNIFAKKKLDLKERLLIKTAITSLLRGISSASTGWPYIAPKKIKNSSSQKEF